MNNKPIVFFVSLMALTLALVVVFQINTNPFGNSQVQTSRQQSDPAIKLFADNCARCHGSFGQGKGNYPSLQGLSLTQEKIASIIRSGRGKMPPFTRLSAAQIQTLAQFVGKM